MLFLTLNVIVASFCILDVLDIGFALSHTIFTCVCNFQDNNFKYTKFDISDMIIFQTEVSVRWDMSNFDGFSLFFNSFECLMCSAQGATRKTLFTLQCHLIALH
jgi:hypothetical protein